jgi:hypothetical protein
MSIKVESVGKTENGKFIPSDPVSRAIGIQSLNGKPTIETLEEYFPKRSTKQNSAWHGIVVPIYMACMGHTNHDFAHYELVTKIDPLVTIDIKGREHIGPTPTKNKTTKESMELYKKAQDFIAIEYQVEVPDPSPDWKGF